MGSAVMKAGLNHAYTMLGGVQNESRKSTACR